MEWINTSNNPKEESMPPHAGRYDDCSKEVLVYYVDKNNYTRYGIGYTDWDGDNFFWIVNRHKDDYKNIIAFSLLPDELPKEIIYGMD